MADHTPAEPVYRCSCAHCGKRIYSPPAEPFRAVCESCAPSPAPAEAESGRSFDMVAAAYARDRLHRKLDAAAEAPLVLDRSDQVDLRLVLDVFTMGIQKLCEKIEAGRLRRGDG